MLFNKIKLIYSSHNFFHEKIKKENFLNYLKLIYLKLDTNILT